MVVSDDARHSAPTPHLIDSKCLPFDICKLLCVPKGKLVCSQQDIHLHSLVGAKFIFSDDLTGSSNTYVSDDVEFGGPGRKLRLPGGDSGQWYNDKERTVLVHFVEKVRQK